MLPQAASTRRRTKCALRRMLPLLPGSRPGRTGDDGNAAVEFALILPMLLLILFGIIQFGYLFVVHNAMTNAAREGARMAAVQQVDVSDAEAAVGEALERWGLGFNIASQLTTDADGREEFVLRVSLPMGEVAFGDLIGAFVGRTIETAVSMRRE